MTIQRTNARAGTFSPGASLFSVSEWQAIARSLGLSPRELDVVKGIFDDQCEREIARSLGLSAHTVHAHVERIYAKLVVTSRVQLLVTVFSRNRQSPIHGAHGQLIANLRGVGSLGDHG